MSRQEGDQPYETAFVIWWVATVASAAVVFVEGPGWMPEFVATITGIRALAGGIAVALGMPADGVVILTDLGVATLLAAIWVLVSLMVGAVIDVRSQGRFSAGYPPFSSRIAHGVKRLLARYLVTPTVATGKKGESP